MSAAVLLWCFLLLTISTFYVSIAMRKFHLKAAGGSVYLRVARLGLQLPLNTFSQVAFQICHSIHIYKYNIYKSACVLLLLSVVSGEIST